MTLPPALRHRQFLIFWLGMLLSWTGNQMLIWTLPWHIRAFTDNPAALGSIGLLRLLPTLTLSLFAGVLADRLNRRKLTMLTQSLMGLTALTLALLTLSGRLQLWMIYALLLVHTAAFLLDLPARYALTPNIVPEEALTNALGLETLALQIGGVAGPLLNGLLLERLGEQASYLGAFLFFAGMVLTLALMGDVPQENAAPRGRGVDWEAIREGVRFTFTHPLILPAMLLDFLATVMTRADSLLSYVARDILHVSGSAYGLLTAAPMLGALTAGLVFAQLRTVRGQGRLVLGAVGMIGAGAVLFGLSRAFWLSTAALYLMGAADAVSTIVRSAIRQFQTPDRLRGRMTSVNQIFFMGGPYLGDVKSGFLGSLIGVPLAIALGGVACVLGVAWIDRRWPQFRRYQGVENIQR
ncbi:MAG: MFS transporter [Anaerolineae bacterium]|nr:MAG: MFS transporter [Anaerolineae bacterium]